MFGDTVSILKNKQTNKHNWFLINSLHVKTFGKQLFILCCVSIPDY